MHSPTRILLPAYRKRTIQARFRPLGYLTKSTISLHEFASEANEQINYLHLTIIVTLD